MLRPVAEGVLVHTSDFMQTNTIVVLGGAGVLLIDPGVHDSEVECLANDLRELGQTVAAGFSTHPHWDHMLWHPSFGSVTRHATARCAITARERLSIGIEQVVKMAGIPDQVPLELLGDITGLPSDADHIPWDGPRVRILEHQAHAPGHAALLIEDRRVLVAGDMVSDILIPMLDLRGPADPAADYLAALRLLEGAADDVDVFVPGHGSTGGPDELRTRIEHDRAYVQALPASLSG